MKQVLEYVQSFVTISLILAGLGGIAYNMFREGGWLGSALGKVWDVNLEHPVIAIPLTIGLIVIGKLWISHARAKGHASKMPDVLVYVIMAAGVYFIWQYFSHGMEM